jgi:hypothetical protein
VETPHERLVWGAQLNSSSLTESETNRWTAAVAKAIEGLVWHLAWGVGPRSATCGNTGRFEWDYATDWRRQDVCLGIGRPAPRW